MDDKQKLTQLEELMANLTRNVDRLEEKMERLEEYTWENNKVVNSILHKLDDHAEQFERNDQRFQKSDKRFEVQEKMLEGILNEMSEDRKLRDAQFEFLLKRTEL